MADRNPNITDQTGIDIVNKLRTLGGNTNIYKPTHQGRNPGLSDATGKAIVDALDGIGGGSGGSDSGVFILEIQPNEALRACIDGEAIAPSQIPMSQTYGYEIVSSATDILAAIESGKTILLRGSVSTEAGGLMPYGIISEPISFVANPEVPGAYACYVTFMDIGIDRMSMLQPGGTKGYITGPCFLTGMIMVAASDDTVTALGTGKMIQIILAQVMQYNNG